MVGVFLCGLWWILYGFGFLVVSVRGDFVQGNAGWWQIDGKTMSDSFPSEQEVLAQASWIRGLVRSMIQDEHLAEDLAQDAMEAGLKGKGPQGGNPRAWLAGVVRNQVRQQQRAARRRGDRERRSARPAHAVSTAELVARVEIQKRVASAVLGLPEPYRKSLLLRFYEGLSVRRIATLLEVPRKTVESRLYRGLRLLRGELHRSLGDSWAGVVLPLAIPVGTVPSVALTSFPVLMTSKSISLAAVALILACGLLFWPRSPVGGSDDDGAPDRGAVATAEPSEAGAGTLAEVPPPLGREAVDAAVAAVGGGSARGRLRVRVVQDHSGEPVAGAEVYWVDEDVAARQEYLTALEGAGDHLGGIIEVFGWHGTTGNDGTLDLDARVGQVVMAGSANGLWGSVRRVVGPGQAGLPEVVELRLLPDFGVGVVVVDERGEPLSGIPVAYHTAASWPPDGKNMSATTDPQGQVELRHLGDLISWRPGYKRLHFVSIELPVHPRVHAEFDPRQTPPVELKLVLPAGGAVEVELRDLAGELSGDQVQVFLQKRMSAQQRERRNAPPSRMAPWSELGLISEYSSAGTVRFDHVGLGLELEVGAQFESGGDLRRTTFTGPIREGETVRIRLNQARATPSVAGRILDENGQPWSDASQGLLLWVRDGGRVMTSRIEVIPDEAGRFQALCADVPTAIPLTARFALTAKEAGTVRLWASEVLNLIPPSGLDLGDLQLPQQPLVGGVVVNPAAEPVSAVNVMAIGTSFNSADNPPDAEGQIRSRLRRQLWNWNDSQGSFVFRAPHQLFKEFAVAATPSTRLNLSGGARSDYTPGQTDLRLVVGPMQQGIRGTLLVDPWLIHAISISLYSERKDPVSGNLWRGSSTVSLNSSGEYHQKLEANGTQYQVLVEDALTGMVLHRSDWHPIHPGQVTTVPPIDLRNMLREHRIHVSSKSAEPLEGLRFLSPDLVHPQVALEMKNPARLLTHTTTHTIEVVAKGHRPQQVTLDREEITVVLERGYPLSIQVQGLEQIPTDTPLVLKLTPAGPPSAETRSLSTELPLDANRSAQGFALHPGSWKLTIIHYRTTTQNSTTITSNEPLGSATIEVLNVEELQFFSLISNPEFLAEFLSHDQ